MAKTKTSTRKRLTRVGYATLDMAIYSVAVEQHPVGNRGIYYDLKARGVEGGDDYQRVIARTVLMRENWAMQLRGAGNPDKPSMPMSWVTGDRSFYDNQGYDGLEDQEYLSEVVYQYKLNPWTHHDSHIVIYTESRSLQGIVQPVAGRWHVNCRTGGGQVPVAEAWDGANAIVDSGKQHVRIGYLGDLNFYGDRIEDQLLAKIKRYTWALGWDGRIDFERIALTAEQVYDHDLPVLQAKRPWRLPFEAEGEAMPANLMRETVEGWLAQFMSSGDLRENADNERLDRQAIEYALGDAPDYR